ncbi:MAG: hypothetical protein ACFFDT_04345 [Candidatus Hodarchaeota archaeon]
MNPNYKLYYVINKTTMNYYNTQEEGKGLYLAYSWSIENQNFSNSIISAVLEDIQLVDKYLYNRLDHYRYDGWRLEPWTRSQDIIDIYLLSGWLIFQRLEYGILRGPLDGTGVDLTQISIINSDMNLLWIASSIMVWIA